MIRITSPCSCAIVSAHSDGSRSTVDFISINSDETITQSLNPRSIGVDSDETITRPRSIIRLDFSLNSARFQPRSGTSDCNTIEFRCDCDDADCGRNPTTVHSPASPLAALASEFPSKFGPISIDGALGMATIILLNFNRNMAVIGPHRYPLGSGIGL